MKAIALIAIAAFAAAGFAQESAQATLDEAIAAAARLLHAADANLGIKLARSRRPEAILIDLDLALGALEFVKVLRADPATETTPILA